MNIQITYDIDTHLFLQLTIMYRHWIRYTWVAQSYIFAFIEFFYLSHYFKTG